jgi:hypothetical protein
MSSAPPRAGLFFSNLPFPGGGRVAERRYNQGGHRLEQIVAGNEPAVSGGFGSQVIRQNDDDAT